MVAKWALFGVGPPSKPPDPTLDHGLISPKGCGFLLYETWGNVESSEVKEASWKTPVTNFSKGARFSLNWGKQSEQILFEKLNVFGA